MVGIGPGDLFVTTRKGPDPAEVAEARSLADTFGLPFTERLGRSIAFHARQTGRQAGLVVQDDALTLVIGSRRLGFHPNMAARRIAEGHARGDHFLAAAELAPGDRVLDLTCGMGADAIVAAHATGPGGRVVALEASPLLARIVARGLAHHPGDADALTQAMRRVEVIAAEARSYLAGLPDNSFDVVALDPMFETAKGGGSGLDLVRLLAHDDLPDAGLIDAARRVARRAVVMADGAPGERLDRFGFEVAHRKRRKWWGRISAQP